MNNESSVGAKNPAKIFGLVKANFHSLFFASSSPSPSFSVGLAPLPLQNIEVWGEGEVSGVSFVTIAS